MIRESNPAVYWWPLKDALVEAGEPHLVSQESQDFSKADLSCDDALIFMFFGDDQSAPGDLTEAFDRTFGKA